jgi:hypothetical protein
MLNLQPRSRGRNSARSRRVERFAGAMRRTRLDKRDDRSYYSPAEAAAILPVILVLLSCVRPEAARLRWVSWQPQDMAPEWCAAHQAARADAILDKVSRFCERTSGTRH